MHIYRTISAVIFGVFILASVPARGQTAPQYFFETTTNSENGGKLGENCAGNPFEWEAVHSELSGHRSQELKNLRYFGKENANWTFLWTRSEGDTASYKVYANFEVRKDFVGAVQIEVGFDEVRATVQKPWPDGFWVSQESYWQTASDRSQEEAGEFNLKTNEGIDIPSDVDHVYIRVRSLGGSSDPEQLIWIKQGEVTFEKRSN